MRLPSPPKPNARPFVLTRSEYDAIKAAEPTRGNMITKLAIAGGFVTIIDDHDPSVIGLPAKTNNTGSRNSAFGMSALNASVKPTKQSIVYYHPANAADSIHKSISKFDTVNYLSLLKSPLASDATIKYLSSKNQLKPLFTPFVDSKTAVDEKGRGIPSYGLSSSGYDSRCNGEVLVYRGNANDIIDPRDVDKELFYKLPVIEDDTGRYVLVPPKSFILSATLEWVNIPRTHMAIVNTKSTYARAGLQTLTTPLEAGWSGIVTLEFVNHTNSKIKLYIDGGVVQINLFRTDFVDKDYVQAGGKYQNQVGVTMGNCHVQVKNFDKE